MTMADTPLSDDDELYQLPFDQVAESEPVELYDAVLQINVNGAWNWNQPGRVDPSATSR